MIQQTHLLLCSFIAFKIKQISLNRDFEILGQTNPNILLR